MFLSKHIKTLLLICFIVTNAIVGNAHSVVSGDLHQQNDVLKSGLLLDSKGIIEPVSEICYGGSFQLNIYKLKNSFGSNSSFSVKQNATSAFISWIYTFKSDTGRIPLFLYNRRILI